MSSPNLFDDERCEGMTEYEVTCGNNSLRDSPLRLGPYAQVAVDRENGDVVSVAIKLNTARRLH